MTSDIASQLHARLQTIDADIGLIGPDALDSRDPGWHPQNFGAGVMALPGSAAAVSALVGWCARENVAIVPQGGRTGLAGGATSRPGEVILSTARLNAIVRIDAAERTAVVEAGVTLEQLQTAAAAYGLTTGIDVPSRGSATIGGMVSTNAGGILAFRNGVMRHQVLGLEVVLPDGQVMSDLTRVVKVSAGPDLKQIFIGAEGALGVVTRVALKLETRRTERATALIGVPDAGAALAVIAHFQALPAVTLEGAELMWSAYFRDSARDHGFDLAWMDGAEPPAVLLVELSAETVDIATQALETGLESLWDTVGMLAGIVAQSLDQARRFWQLREDGEFIYRLHPDAPSFDVSVPPGHLDAYVAGLRSRLQAADPAYGAYVYGHIADGNLHLSITHAGAATPQAVLAIEDAVYTGIADAGGSFSAEHGVGLDKRHAYLTFGNPQKRTLARAIKALVDPQDLFNRGKVPF